MDNGSFKSEISMINYNGSLMRSESASLEINNRGFSYGDGIFETIIFRKNEIIFQNEHWERITEGIEGLKMSFPFSKTRLLDMLKELLDANKLSDQHARIKLYIWRETGGLYAPSSFKTKFLITADKTEKKQTQSFSKVGIAKTVFLQKTAVSHLKTISALPYVMAGIEKNERELEELILLNNEGNIAEASASNIYIYDAAKRKIYTPSLDTGCINGVSRRYLIDNAKAFDLDVHEVLWKPEDLDSDMSIFTINVAGVNCIQKIEERELGDSAAGLKLLQKIFNC
jgi:branched-chain amino acid aminotransferase/4-amino-4-deoxychorismate lyase